MNRPRFPFWLQALGSLLAFVAVMLLGVALSAAAFALIIQWLRR